MHSARAEYSPQSGNLEVYKVRYFCPRMLHCVKLMS